MTVLHCCIDGINENKPFNTFLTDVSKGIIKQAMERNAKDNISCIFLCFDNLYKCYIGRNEKALKNAIKQLGLKYDFEKLYDEYIEKKFYDNKMQIKESKKENKKKGFFLRCCGIFN